MSDEERPVWERQAYETPSMWAYFRLYLDQDSPRSINAAYRTFVRIKRGEERARQIKNAPGSWRSIAAGKTRSGQAIDGAFTWQERAAAYEDYLADQERRKWAARRQELKEREWETASKLLEKAEQMLLFPVMVQEVEGENTLIFPAKWSMRDIPTIVQAGSKIARLAADMSTENLAIDWREEARREGIENPDELFRKLVSRIESELEGSNDERSLPGSESEPGEDQE
jgi:hypothetical protein